MSRRPYLDFELSLEREGEGYRSRVLKAPTGEASVHFSRPLSEAEERELLARIGHRQIRRMESLGLQAAQTLGAKLFGSAFAEGVRDCLRGSLEAAEERSTGLRLRLRFDGVPELADLPWEYLWDPSSERFLALSNETPIVRYLEVPERIRPLVVEPPLRILTVLSSPAGYPALDTEGEWGRMQEALRDVTERGLVTLDRLESATLTALRRRLRQASYHILHFIGHGTFNLESGDGELAFEEESGRVHPVAGHVLAVVLRDLKTIRLVVLNSCEGARADRGDLFGGTAQSLVKGGIPAVIAMQFEISDRAALAFAAELYRAVAEGLPVDAAVTEARLAIFAGGNELEWGTPVLFLRSADGHIFDVAGTPTAHAPLPGRRSGWSRRWTYASAGVGAAFLVLAVLFILWSSRHEDARGVETRAAAAGRVTGTVTCPDCTRSSARIVMTGNDCSWLQPPDRRPTDQTVLVNREKRLANVFVHVKEGLRGPPPPFPLPAVLETKSCFVVPRVLGIRTGQSLMVRNSDPFEHRVVIRSVINPDLESSLSAGEAVEWMFPQPELMIPVECARRPWMKAFLSVVSHSFFAVSDSAGTFAIPGLSPGTYTLEAHHESLGTLEQEITINAGESTATAFEFEPEAPPP